MTTHTERQGAEARFREVFAHRERAEPPAGRAATRRSGAGGRREALLLVAWEELTPTEAARALGINPAAFRVRLLRARRRLRAKLEEPRPAPHLSQLDVEGT